MISFLGDAQRYLARPAFAEGMLDRVRQQLGEDEDEGRHLLRSEREGRDIGSYANAVLDVAVAQEVACELLGELGCAKLAGGGVAREEVVDGGNR